jgi:cytidine deaminase
MVISEVLVVSEGTQLIVPCGGCRQKLLEFSKSETLIHLATQTEIKKTLSMDELLPFSFDKTYFNI